MMKEEAIRVLSKQIVISQQCLCMHVPVRRSGLTKKKEASSRPKYFNRHASLSVFGYENTGASWVDNIKLWTNAPIDRECGEKRVNRSQLT